MNLRKEARNRPCMVRLPECDGGGETTVLAHYRNGCGIGMKPDDLAYGAWCCAKCHDAIDGRRHVPYHTKAEIRLAHAEGVMRTIYQLTKEGKL